MLRRREHTMQLKKAGLRFRSLFASPSPLRVHISVRSSFRSKPPTSLGRFPPSKPPNSMAALGFCGGAAPIRAISRGFTAASCFDLTFLVRVLTARGARGGQARARSSSATESFAKMQQESLIFFLVLIVSLAGFGMASRAPVFIQNENLPIFRGIDGKKAGVARGPAARAGRQERKALGDLSRARKVPLASVGGKASAAASVRESNNVVKPSYLSDEQWMKCCEWAKGGTETASFTGNDAQKMVDDKREESIRKKMEKAMGTFQLSMDSLYDIGVPSEISMANPDDEIKLELDPEFIPSAMHLRSRLGEQDGNYLFSDLEFEHEPFANCNFDLKLKDDYGNDSSSSLTILLP